MLLPALWLSAGCAGWGYDHVRLGATPREYDRALPADDVRRTELGLASLSRSDLRGRTDATVLLWTLDRRIWAKVHVTIAEPARSGLRPATFTLRAEIHPALGGMPGATAADALHAIETELAAFRGERGVMEAFGWVAAGLRVARFADASAEPVAEASAAAGPTEAGNEAPAVGENSDSGDTARPAAAAPANLADYLDRIPPTAAVRMFQNEGVLHVELTAR